MKTPSLKVRIDRALDYLFRAQPDVIVPPVDRGDAPAVRTFDSKLAQAEGWDVFDCGLREDGSSRIEIQRLDNPDVGPPVFRSDHAAWDHVVARAQAGSMLHLRALQMIDPIERKLIRCFCAPQKLPI